MNDRAYDEPRERRRRLAGRGGEMALLEFGPADRPIDVIFSHANGFNARTYRTILAPVAQHLRILALDMRGHGATDLPTVIEGRGGWDDFRDDLLALMAAEVERPVLLAGHSMGGTASLLAAAAAPEQVRALALFDPVIFTLGQVRSETAENPLADGAQRRRAVFPSKAAALEAYTGRGAFRSWRPEQLADYVEAGFRDTDASDVTLACAPAWEASNFRTHNCDAWAAFRATRGPVRLLRAEVGSTARIDEGLEALTADGRIRVEVIPGTSHFLPMERPDVVQATIRELCAD